MAGNSGPANALCCSAGNPRRQTSETPMRDPVLNLLLILVIGIVAGVIFDRVAGPGWLARQFTGPRGYVTSSLVGIAGAFIGFHVAVLMAIAGLIAGYIAAALGAIVVLLLWRGIR
jgi:uncharacterized membrane protein YeaQ/YmgE (transglycosylase-associated protein family)